MELWTWLNKKNVETHQKEIVAIMEGYLDGLTRLDK